MDALGKQFLAGARFPKDQHRTVCFRVQLRFLLGLRHSGAVAANIVEAVLGVIPALNQVFLDSFLHVADVICFMQDQNRAHGYFVHLNELGIEHQVTAGTGDDMVCDFPALAQQLQRFFIRQHLLQRRVFLPDILQL